jgi:hypothetical protein
MRLICPIGVAGQTAAGETRRRGERLRPRTLAGRHEAAVPSLAARLLQRSAPLRPHHVTSLTRTELHPGAAGRRGLPGPPGADGVAGAPGRPAAPAAGAPAIELRLVRETLRERIDRTVERLIARGRRDEPAPRSTLPPPRPDAPPWGAGPPLPTRIFPTLAPPTRPTAAPVPASPPAVDQRLAEATPAFAPPVAAPTAPAAAHVPPLPQLVDEIVGELERRAQGQRERRGLLA